MWQVRSADTQQNVSKRKRENPAERLPFLFSCDLRRHGAASQMRQAKWDPPPCMWAGDGKRRAQKRSRKGKTGIDEPRRRGSISASGEKSTTKKRRGKDEGGNFISLKTATEPVRHQRACFPVASVIANTLRQKIRRRNA